jgi:hypothetical protein
MREEEKEQIDRTDAALRARFSTTAFFFFKLKDACCMKCNN